jgi:hypothetical protein
MYQAEKLMTQCDVLGDEICRALEDGDDHGKNQRELEGHPANDSLSPNGRKKLAVSRLYPIMMRHSVRVSIDMVSLG